jgi:hypothetical protein
MPPGIRHELARFFLKSDRSTERLHRSRVLQTSLLYFQRGQLTGDCLPSAVAPHVHVRPSKVINEWRSAPRPMKDGATGGDGGIAVLPDLNLILHRRLHVVRVVAARRDVIRTIQPPTVLFQETEVLGCESLKCCPILTLYRCCPLIFDCQDFRAHRFEVSFAIWRSPASLL